MTHSKSQSAYQLIRERIATHEFLPGHRLILAQLASDLDMSVVPIREAIRRLEAEGIVEYEKNVGARVTSIDREEYLNTMQALAIVEGAATALASQVISAKRIAEARALNDQITHGLPEFDPVAYARLNHEFHALLTVDCPNQYLRRLVDEGWARIEMVRAPSTVFSANRAQSSVAEHEQILALIESGADPIAIEAAVRKHRTAARDAALARGPFTA